MHLRNLNLIAFIIISIISPSLYSVVEFKSNIFFSFATVGTNDAISSSHNTLLMGSDNVKVGGYFGHENRHGSTTDTSAGGAIRIGENTYFELNGGAFKRTYKYNETELEGVGVSGNIILGKHLSKNVGVSLLVNGKHITKGMDKRWIYTLLPYIGLRTSF
ncbi:hypothetical protein N9N67_00835 [Bacteriovoracaceae bacterium]|nr:hypothetical protein [Bacteriovoracaceae bacterium]